LNSEYEKYEKVSKAVYEIFMKYTSQVQAVSADEAFLDLSVFDDPEMTVEMIRREIYHTTGCTASAGIGKRFASPPLLPPQINNSMSYLDLSRQHAFGPLGYKKRETKRTGKQRLAFCL